MSESVEVKEELKTQNHVIDPTDFVPIVVIGFTKSDKKLVVTGQIENRELCLNALADAIKVVCNYKRSSIITPR